MSAIWKIQLLGGVALCRDGNVVTRFRAQKAAALLAYLSYFRSRSHSREVLADLFWPESHPEDARQSLRSALASLRRQLEPADIPAGTVLRADRLSVRLNPGAVSTDVAEFLDALKAARQVSSGLDSQQYRLQAASEYQAELLPGYYDEWIVPERENLHRQNVQNLRDLARYFECSGEYHSAIEYAARAVDAEPLEEELSKELMRLYGAAGQPAAAIRQYRRLTARLKQELGTEPSPETRLLASQIKRSVANPRPVDENMPAPPAPQPRLSAAVITFCLFEILDSNRPFPGASEREWQTLCGDKLNRWGGAFVRHNAGCAVTAFSRASDALSFALEVQSGTESLHNSPSTSVSLPTLDSPEVDQGNTNPQQLRCALYTRECDRAGENYSHFDFRDGLGMLLAAHEGQILLSEETVALLRRNLEPSLEILDLGLHRLIAESPVGSSHNKMAGSNNDSTDQIPPPIRLYRVERRRNDSQPSPPPRTRAVFPDNLPLQLTRFFGRETEYSQLKNWLLNDSSRLITLTGPGGTGKTRLAVEVAGEISTSRRYDVLFVPLADVSDSERITDAILQALKLLRSPTEEPIETLARALQGQPLILVLDNFEHLEHSGSPVLLGLLNTIPSITCLVTSRHALRLPGEQEFLLQPLPTPVANHEPADLFRCASVQLFLDRSQLLVADFQLTAGNAASIGLLCRRLEGIPLALELAAARISVLSPAEMVEQLDHRFDLLVSRQRGITARHRTLRAAMDWSYQLLPADLQQFLSRLSIFRGGWTLSAALAISAVPCDPPNSPISATAQPGVLPSPIPVLDSLSHLQECSFVISDTGTAEARFRMLDTLREYAREQLPTQHAHALASRHFRFYAELARDAAPALGGPKPMPAIQRLAAEQDNLRAALEWALQDDPEGALHLAADLCQFWQVQGLLAEGMAWIKRALHVSPDAPVELRARVLCGAGSLAALEGDLLDARQLLEAGIALTRTLDDRAALPPRLTVLGRVLTNLGQSSLAHSFYDEALNISRELNDDQGIQVAISGFGYLAFLQGDVNAARSVLESMQSASYDGREIRAVAFAQQTMGLAAFTQGDYEEAQILLESSLTTLRPLGEQWNSGRSIWGLGLVALARGDTQKARPYFHESMGIVREARSKWGIVYAIEGFAYLAAHEGSAIRAAKLLGAADALRESMHLAPTTAVMPGFLQYRTMVSDVLSKRAFEVAWQEGRNLTWEQAAALAVDETASAA